MSSRKKTIAILRGGKDDYSRSLKNGANIILSLSRYGDLVEVTDVILDNENNWFEKGIPSNPHKVFSKADFYLDLTSNVDEDYHELAKKLDVEPVFRDNHVSTPNRVNIKRILNQLNVSVPKYILIRDKESLRAGLTEAWNRFQVPIVVKEATHEFNEKSLITYSFLEAFEKARNILVRGKEVILEEHIAGKYVSVAAIPDYRGESLYIPTPAEIINTESFSKTFSDKIVQNRYLPDHVCDKRCLLHIDESLKNEIRNLTENIYRTFALDRHALIDLAISEIKPKGERGQKPIYTIKVLDIHTSPSLFEDSRFDFILKNSGVDIGRFIIDKMNKLEEEKMIY